MIAKTPQPLYYAVIFTSLSHKDQERYAEMTEKKEYLAREQPGYLGFESARSEIGISISYWKDLASIQDWKKNSDRLLAQNLEKKTGIALILLEFQKWKEPMNFMYRKTFDATFLLFSHLTSERKLYL